MSKSSLSKTTFNLQQLGSHGDNVYINGNVEITRPWLIHVGHNVMIDAFFHCTTRLELDDYIHIAAQCGVIGGDKGVLRMGHFTGLAAGCQVVCGTDDYAGGGGLRNSAVPMKFRNVTWAPVILEPFVTVGVNSVILPGVTLAIGSCVGANSLVNRDTEPWTMYVGSPARSIDSIPRDIILEHARTLGYHDFD